MNKAFVQENDNEDDEQPSSPSALPSGTKNYISSTGYQRLYAELEDLIKVERPKIVETVAWAASNGDRSENGDYIYGKKRLREIDRRIRFLNKRIENAEVIDISSQAKTDQIFFGATVTLVDELQVENTYTIVGVDEINLKKNYISWISPLARAMIKGKLGDIINFHSPGGKKELEIIAIVYRPLN